MEEIEFIKNTEVYKAGDVVEISENDAKQIINEGYARNIEALIDKKPYQITKEEKNKICGLNGEEKDNYIYEICKKEGTTYTKILAQLQQEEKKEDIKIVSIDNTDIEAEDLEPAESDKRTLKVNILDIFKPGQDNMTLTSSGNYKMECPDCGMQGGRTEGFIIYPKSNQASCHSSGKWFKLLEAYALKKKLIKCLDGREKGELDKKVLGGELWTHTLLEFKDEFGVDIFSNLCEDWGIKKRVQIPGKFRLQSSFADDVARVFYSRNLLFLRAESGNIIKIKVTKKVDKDDDKKMLTIERGFEELTSEEFITLLELYIDPYLKTYYKDGTSQEAPYSINKETAGITLASPNFKFKMPPLERMFDIQIPIVYKKKLTFPKRGYDRRFGSYLPSNAPKIKQNVYSLEEAVAFIEKIFEEFCFKNRKDFMHAIAAFITPFCKGLFSKFSARTPVFIYMANRERAGKDYLAGCTGMLYEGIATEQPPISTDEKGGFGNNNEELRKKITSCMIEGKKRFHSSNNKGLLNNSVLESVTTLDTWEDRMLGKNKTVNYPNEMEYSLSGNIGMSLTPDLINRARMIDLQLAIEDANCRTFKNPRLHAWILDNREDIISALYTIIRHWWDSGAKPGKEPFASFPEWASIIGGIMESCGWDNPCTKDDVTIIALDEETTQMKLLYETIYEQKPNIWISIGDMQDVVEKENIMPDLNFQNKSDQIRFGKLIAKYNERIMSDIIMKVQDNRKSERRKYRFVKLTSIISSEKNHIVDLQGGDVVIKGDATTLLYSKDFKFFTCDGVVTPPNIPNIPTSLPSMEKQNDKTDKNNIIDLKENDDKENIVYKEVDEENDKEVAMSAIFGHGTTPSYVENLKSLLYSDTGTCPNMHNMATSIKEHENDAKSPGPQVPIISTGKVLELKTKPLDYFTKKMDVAKQEELDKRLKKAKSNRELQFWEDPQCAGIVAVCTKEQTYEWIKTHPHIKYKQMREELGLGASRFIVDLTIEGKIKRAEVGGWEVIENVS